MNTMLTSHSTGFLYWAGSEVEEYAKLAGINRDKGTTTTTTKKLNFWYDGGNFHSPTLALWNFVEKFQISMEYEE